MADFDLADVEAALAKHDEVGNTGGKKPAVKDGSFWSFLGRYHTGKVQKGDGIAWSHATMGWTHMYVASRYPSVAHTFV